jgi:hypothetical protein
LEPEMASALAWRLLTARPRALAHSLIIHVSIRARGHAILVPTSRDSDVHPKIGLPDLKKALAKSAGGLIKLARGLAKPARPLANLASVPFQISNRAG